MEEVADLRVDGRNHLCSFILLYQCFAPGVLSESFFILVICATSLKGNFRSNRMM